MSRQQHLTRLSAVITSTARLLRSGTVDDIIGSSITMLAAVEKSGTRVSRALEVLLGKRARDDRRRRELSVIVYHARRLARLATDIDALAAGLERRAGLPRPRRRGVASGARRPSPGDPPERLSESV